MTDYSTVTAGIDVAKDKLDIALYPNGGHLLVTYTQYGLKQLDRFLCQHKVTRVGFEASGGYEWPLMVHLRKGAIPAVRLQPAQVRAFAKSKLQRAKNDKLDAALIAAFTASLESLPPLPDEQHDGLADHLTYIEQAEERLAILKTNLEATRIARLRRLIETEIRQLESKRKAEIARLIKTIAANAELLRRFRLLVSIKGVGERTALSLLIRLPELGNLRREQVAALAGVAPFDNDSGRAKKRRSVAGGRQRLRKSLFMAAFSATTWNDDLKAFYMRLRTNGKHHLTAIIAVMRKLVILANTIIARNSPWIASRPTH